jgi:hypothetical protein
MLPVRGDTMDEPKRKRVQLSKAEKRVLAEESTRFAFADTENKRIARNAKTARLKALRLAAV